MDEITTGGAGFLGIVLGYLGCKARIKNIESSVKELRSAVRYEITCVEIHKAINTRLGDMMKLQEETRKDVKKLLARDK